MNKKRLLNNIIIFLSFSIKCFYTFSSLEIWGKSQQYLKKYGLNSKYHFIYDQNQYTRYLPTDKKMKELYEKQKSLYKEYNLTNYIFLIENIDSEPIDEAIDNLANKIEINYGIDIKQSIICIFTINNNKIKIKAGKNASEILTNENIKEMYKKLENNIYNKEYYEACKLLLETIDEYYSNFIKLQSNKSNISRLIILIVVIIITIIIFIALVILFIYIRRHSFKIPRDDNLKKIINFLKRLNKEEINLSDYCAICLEELNLNMELMEVPFVIKETSALSCGHIFHLTCINKWKTNNECPICTKRVSNYNDRKARTVWKIQKELNPKYIHIRYKSLFSQLDLK